MFEKTICTKETAFFFSHMFWAKHKWNQIKNTALELTGTMEKNSRLIFTNCMESIWDLA